MTTTIQNKKEIQEQGYDEMPYISFPFEYNRPENLHAVAHLFGIDSPALEKARILELGGAEGGNLIKFAVDFPNAEVIGIDLSKKQVEMGQERINKMGLKNYQLKHMSITDLDESMGKFDYIICHGVYSWVPDFVKDSILENCNKLLSNTGVAFVSYNTLPGWNMVKTIRDLMLFHSHNFEKVEDQVQQSRLALDFICESLQNADTPYSNFMRRIANDLKMKGDDYLRHEFLAENNDPCYFHEFVTNAAKHGLTYVGDTDYQRMNVGNLPKPAAELLSQIPDIVRTEQYVDFIMNSQFRCSLLSKSTTQPNRNITADRLKQFKFNSDIICENQGGENQGDKNQGNESQVTEADILGNKSLKFTKLSNQTAKIFSANPEQKALLFTLAEATKPLSYDELVEQTQNKFSSLNKAAIAQALSANLGTLIFSRYVDFCSYVPNHADKVSDKPKIHDADLYRFKNKIPSRMCWLTNSTNKLQPVDLTFAHILEFFDGEHSADQIINEVINSIKKGKLNLEQNGKAVTDDKLIKQAAKDFYNHVCNTLLTHNLLVS